MGFYTLIWLSTMRRPVSSSSHSQISIEIGWMVEQAVRIFTDPADRLGELIADVCEPVSPYTNMLCSDLVSCLCCGPWWGPVRNRDECVTAFKFPVLLVVDAPPCPGLALSHRSRGSQGRV